MITTRKIYFQLNLIDLFKQSKQGADFKNWVTFWVTENTASTQTFIYAVLCHSSIVAASTKLTTIDTNS